MQNINVELFQFFNHSLENPFFNAFMPFITHFGGFIWLVVIMLLVIGYAWIKNKQSLRKIAILTLIALLFSDLIVFCIKHLINAPRPFISLSNVNLLIAENDPYSFPSGHVTSTFSVVTFFILNMKELAKKHYMLADIALIIFAIVIMFSRVYVGVHYPGDVLAGAIIGICGAFIINRFKDEILSIIKI